MPAHQIIERAHRGPRLLQTFATREEATRFARKLVAENPEMARDLYVVMSNAVDASQYHPG